jgi:hypothetical protein
MRQLNLSSVMRGLDPRIHVLTPTNSQKTWMAGTSPAMTKKEGGV